MATQSLISTNALADAAAQVMAGVSEGHMSSAAYDTAWVARLATRPHGDRFVPAANWLLEHQHADGSWGGRIHFAEDRAVCTLAAVNALHANRSQTPNADRAIQAGVAYLNASLGTIDDDGLETGAFELLAPALAAEARALGLNLQSQLPPHVERMRAQKLYGVPPWAMYSQQASLVHNLEVLGDGLIVDLARGAQSADGSFGSSPSATAYFLTRAESPEAEGYLTRLLEQSTDGGVGNVYPFDVFEHAWVIANLGDLAARLADFPRLLMHLARIWRPGGVGFSSHCQIVESDDTAVAFRVLYRNNLGVDPAVFRLFEADDFFYGFAFERGHSISANAHILEAVRGVPVTPEITRFRHKAANYLLATQRDDGSWIDKWHVSPYYVTGECVAALHAFADNPVRRAVRWIIESQNSNGSWGFGDGTDEETAYALTSLIEARDLAIQITPDAGARLDRAYRFLVERLDITDYPELWIGKALYTPHAVVRSAVIGALFRYQGMQTPEIAVPRRGSRRSN